jgi:predicted nuclease of predicted toxin-antitoxin system
MRFLADMGVDIRVVNWLRQRGHDAKHLREEGLHRIPNGEIFAKAISGRQKSSVILFRLHNTRAPHVIDRLTAVLSSAT